MGKKVYLTEAQFDALMEYQMMNESLGSIISKVAAGVLSVYMACAMIQGCEHISQEKKDYLKQQVIAAANNSQANIDSTAVYNASAKKSEKKNNVQSDWKKISNDAIVTVYNAVPEQCNTDVNHTASMFKLDLKNPASHRIVALERTFAQKHGLKFGDLIYIKGTYKGRQDGVYQYQDTMNKRFAGMDKVDVLVNGDIKYGGTAKDTTAEIYVLNNPEKKAEYMKNMAPQYSAN
jgi:hypothetical protein